MSDTIDPDMALLFEDAPQAEETETDEEFVADEQADEDEVEAEAPGEDDAEDEDGDDADEDDDSKQEPATFTVKADGEEVTVTLEELKQSYAGQRAIQRRIQEAAETRNALLQEREQFAQFVQQVQARGIVPPPQPPDLSMFDRDPLGYVRERALYDQQLAEYNYQQQQMIAQTQAHMQRQEQARREYLQQEQQRLIDAIPDLGDKAKAKPILEGIVRTAEGYGFSSEELGNIADHRAFKVLHDAMKWRELQEQKGKVQAKAAKAPPMMKPGTAAKPKAQSARDFKQIIERAAKGDKNAELALLFDTPKRKSKR